MLKNPITGLNKIFESRIRLGVMSILMMNEEVNFNDLINVRRIHHSITLIERGETEFKTLEAISFESGFKNRNTFTAAFKKVTGMSPSAYLKRRKPGIESKQHPTFSSNWEDTILKPNVFTAT